MSENYNNPEHSRPNHPMSTVGNFVIGASAGVFSGALGGMLAYEIATRISHESFSKPLIIGSPAIGLGILNGIRAARRDS